MTKTNPAWTLSIPAAAVAVLALAAVRPHPVVRAFAAGVLMLAVFAAVHHAEVIAHRIGEPFGTLVLAVAVLCALSVMTMVMPNHLVATPGPTLARSQLVFVGAISLVLYLTFVFVQTVRHRDYFLVEDAAGGDEHASPPSTSASLASLGLLLVALVAVVGLAKVLSPDVEEAVAAAGAPVAVVGIVISMVVLLPEAVAALRAARKNQLQNSLNLALGSSLASIGLTIPAIAAVSIGFGKPIVLGISAKDTVLLALTMIVNVITLGTGRTTVLQGMVHLTILAAYLFLAVVP